MRTFLVVFSNGGYHENRRSFDRTARAIQDSGDTIYTWTESQSVSSDWRILSGDHAVAVIMGRTSPIQTERRLIQCLSLIFRNLPQYCFVNPSGRQPRGACRDC